MTEGIFVEHKFYDFLCHLKKLRVLVSEWAKSAFFMTLKKNLEVSVLRWI